MISSNKLSLILFLKRGIIPAMAAPTAEISVCSSGPPTCDYISVQAAVNAANPGDLIKVATGVYTGVSSYSGLSQVLYISKTVSIRGGYNTDFTIWNPDVYP